MKKSLFRCLLLLLSICLLLSFAVSGCSAGTQNSDNGAGAAAGGRQPEKPAVKKKLVLWHIQLSDNVSLVINQAVRRYMDKHPDVEVEVVPYLNDAYKIKLVVAMGTRNPPDIFPTWGGGPLYEYIKAGQIYDLTPMMNKDNYKDYFIDDAVGAVTFDNRIWGVPVENIAIAAIFYNKILFAENGITPPVTYSELLNVIKKLRAKQIIPFALANRTKWPGSMFYMYLVDRVGGPDAFRNAADRRGGSFEDEAFVKAGEMIQEMVGLGAFPSGFNGLDYDTGQSRNLLYLGKAAMELMGTWSISTIKDENREFYDRNLDFFAFPAVEGGRGNPDNVIGTFADNFYSVSGTCKYPEEAFDVIKHLIDEEAVKGRTECGRIPPIKSFKAADPMLEGALNLVVKAPSVQLWYDQYLPPELGERHKDTSQALFDGSITPKEAARQMENAARDFYRTQEQ